MSVTQRSGQFFVQNAVRQFLCPCKIFYIGKRVVVHGERDAFFAQEPGEVFTPVEINLDVIRKPRLYLEEHPAKLQVTVVKIIVLALG